VHVLVVFAMSYNVQYVHKLTSFYCNLSMQNIPYNTECTNVHPDDEHIFFEACRRHQELNTYLLTYLITYVLTYLLTPWSRVLL
jgi:hypothetical protein